MRHLGDEDGGHGLVQRGPVHVDGGADGEDEPADPGVHLVLGLQQVDGDGQGGAAGPGAECRGEGVGHVGDEGEGESSGDDCEDQRQNNESVYEQTWR